MNTSLDFLTEWITYCPVYTAPEGLSSKLSKTDNALSQIQVIIVDNMTSKLDQWLIQEIKDRGWSIRELARRAELSHGTINSVLAGRSKPGIDFCLGIAKALRINPIRVFQIAEILPPAPEETPTSRELLYMFMQLDDENQKRIMSITRTFLEEEKERVIIGGEEPATA